MRVRPMGATAVLVEDLPSPPEAWAAGVRDLGVDGIVDVVPAAVTVLVTAVDARAIAAVQRRFAHVVPTAAHTDSARTIEIPVRYDGPDLSAVAETTGMTPDDVVALHTRGTYRAAFCGFAPGFAYLRGLPTELRLPRLATPRTSVPAGSVAIAAEFSAVYPRSSPGGWHLLGRTTAVMFDPDRERAALIEPGDDVRFVAL